MASVSLWVCTITSIIILVSADVPDSTCVEISNVPITEIDVLSFVEGSIDKKLEIAKQFDNAFHSWGAVRLINHGISYQSIVETIDATRRFFDESLEFKQKFSKQSPNQLHGYVKIGDETVGAYKGDITLKQDPVESFHISSNWNNKLELQKGNVFLPKMNNLPQYLQNVLPTYWSNTRQLIYYLNQIASAALGFDIEQNNVFEQNMTAKGGMNIRLSNYPELDLKNKDSDKKYRFNPHQDYTGWTLIANDNIEGLQISVNDSDDNIVWYNVLPKLGGIVVLGGEFFERWTNAHWISSYHAVKAVPDRRISIITFAWPDLSTVIDILPCLKCMKNDRKFEPVVGYKHLEQRMISTGLY